MPALTNRVQIEETPEYRIFTVDSLPDHSHGRFPNPGNPHEITPQSESYRIPLEPSPLTSFRTVGMGAFGLALNGILFEPAAAEFWRNDRRSGWQYEALGHHLDLGEDANHAHVQPTGKYHYHGVPTGLVERLNGESKPALLGYAADGYPVYSHWSYSDAQNPDSALTPLHSSYRLKTGQRSDGPGGSFDGTFVQDYEYAEGLGDLDEANGRYGVTPEFPQGTYYYVITPTFPFIPRLWKGQPGPEFGRGPGGGGGPPDRQNRNRAGGANGLPEVALLQEKSFLTDLRLSPEQATGLTQSLNSIDNSLRNNRSRASADLDDRRAQRLASIAAAEPLIAAARDRWLSAVQNQLVDQTLRRREGANLLLRAEIRQNLALTDLQFAKIYQAIIQSRAAYSVPLSWPELADFLDDDQQTQLTKLIGSIE